MFTNRRTVVVALMGLMASVNAGCSDTNPLGPSTGSVGVSVAGDGSNSFTGVGQTKQLTVSYFGPGFNEDVTGEAAFTSSNPSVVSVSPSGLATARARGRVGIQVSYKGQSAATTLPLGVYLLADLGGTWTVEYAPLADQPGRMTWKLVQSGTRITGTFSDLRSDDFLTLDRRPVAGSFTGDLSGTYQNQTLTWKIVSPALPAWPTCGEFSMSGRTAGIAGDETFSSYLGELTTLIWCGQDKTLSSGGTVSMVRRPAGQVLN